jgi:outer membrane protein OmpA-like peptidoglycan-associated protein
MEELMRIRTAMQTALVVLMGSALWGQEAPKSELDLDYSFARYAPSASYTKGHSLNGGGGRFVYNIGQHFGIAGDLQGYNSNTTSFNIPGNATLPAFNGSVSGNLFTYLFGPVIKFYNVQHINPFFDVLPGAAHSNVYGNAFKTICQPIAGGCGGSTAPASNGFALSAGGGLDIPINRRVDLRVGEFDYLYTRFTNVFNNAGQNNFRYLGGINAKMGVPDLRAPTVACGAEPSETLPWQGPVKVSATPTDFNPKHTLTYGWDSTGGSAVGSGGSATIDTSSLAPGQYTVKSNVMDPKKKSNNMATCTASFTVKQPRPPMIACSANPTSVKPGEPIALTISGSSPDLSAIDKHSFNASSGSLKEGETQHGNQPGEFTSTATIDTTNVNPGPLNVTVGVTDAHGLSSTCVANAEVVAPPAPVAPPMPTAQLVGKCDFNNGNKPTRVDNECKATLDGVALQLKNDSTSRLVVLGYADSAEAGKGKNLDSVRAANVRAYLTKGEGKQQIDASRIEIRKGGDHSVGKVTQIYFLPQNSVLQVDNTDVVDESTLPAKRPGGYL